MERRALRHASWVLCAALIATACTASPVRPPTTMTLDIHDDHEIGLPAALPGEAGPGGPAGRAPPMRSAAAAFSELVSATADDPAKIEAAIAARQGTMVAELPTKGQIDHVTLTS